MPIDAGTTGQLTWARPPGQDVTLTVTLPDATTSEPAVEESPPGVYAAEVDTPFAGRYLLNWESTGSGGAATYSDILDVWPDDPRFIISVDDAAAGLRWRDADKAKNLDSLRLYVAAATEVIEDITGAVLLRTITQLADGGRSGVALWDRPDEIISVEVDGKPWPGYIANTNAGIVYASKHGARFPEGLQTIRIVYRAGAAVIPPSIRLAARELVRHLWQVGQQAPAPSTQQEDSHTVHTPSGFAVPRRVIELCHNRPQLAGIA